MDKDELVKLIIKRDQKVRPLRSLAINGNNEKLKLFIASIAQMLKNQTLHPQTYDQISILGISANPLIVQALSDEIMPIVARFHADTSLDQYIILWGRMYDGSLERRDYPNIRNQLKNIKIRQQYRQLGRLRDYYETFERNFNQMRDQKVEFFQDFEDSVLTDSVVGDSNMTQIIYYDIMEMKALRGRVESATMPEEAAQEVLMKMKHFLKLKTGDLQGELQRQYQNQRVWVKQYVDNREQYLLHKNNVSINQTFMLSREEENIEIIDKDRYAQRRTLKEPVINKIQEAPADLTPNRAQFRSLVPEELQIETTKNKNLKSGNSRVDLENYRQVSYGTPSVNRDIKSGQRQYLAESKRIQTPSAGYPVKFRGPLGLEQDNLSEEIGLDDLVVYKYGTNDLPKKQEIKRDFSITDNYFGRGRGLESPAIGQQSQQGYQSQQGKWRVGEYTSPSRKSGKCKLSDFTSEKKQRKQLAPKQQISTPDDYAVKPYSIHLSNYGDFCRFRRNCMEKSFTLYASSLLLVSCLVRKEAGSQIRLEVLYSNQSKVQLEVQCIYKIPKCFRIQKKSKITRKFLLNEALQHVFSLDVAEFPLEACLLSLRYRLFNTAIPLTSQIPMPISIRNFMECLTMHPQEWIRQWETLTDPSNRRLLRISRHLELQRGVVEPEEIQSVLAEGFLSLGSLQGYSVAEYGCCCYYSQLSQLRFLMRLSLRVDNIISLDVVSDRQVDQNQRDFIEYYLNIWVMLLGKFHH